jgi:hypothetical protein
MLKTCLTCACVFKGRKSARFCCVDCVNESQRIGILRTENELRSIEKYGVDNPSKSEFIKNKIKQTSIERFGVSNPAMSQIVKDKIRLTSLKRYGTESPTSNGSPIRDKIIATNIERYGASCVFSNKEVSEKCRSTLNERYGVDCIFKSNHFYEKVKSTMLDRYGVENAFLLPHVIQKAHSIEALEKRWKSMKINGTIRESRIERDIVDFLESLFKIVHRHVTINGWSIDAFIPSIVTYVQIDGVYWHGLDRPLSEIQSSDRKIDQVILGKIITDNKQNEWFQNQNLKLVRISDLEWKNETNKIALLNKKLLVPVQIYEKEKNSIIE